MGSVRFLVLGLGLGIAAGYVLFDGSDPSRTQGSRSRTQRDRIRGREAIEGAQSSAHREDSPQHDRPAHEKPTIQNKRGVQSTDIEAVKARVRRLFIAGSGDGSGPPEDMLDVAVRRATTTADLYRERLVRAIEGTVRERRNLRREFGELGDGPLRLQAASQGAAKVTISSTGEPAPFGVVPVTGETKTMVHADAGIVPPGKVFVIERIVVVASLGSSAGRQRAGDVAIKLPRARDIGWHDKNLELAFEMVGRTYLEHGLESRLSLAVERAAASVEVHGRLVPDTELDWAKRRPFKMVAGERRGFLTGETVRMQVLADHGGGNPRTLYLDGSTNGRFDRRSDTNIWSDTVDLRRGRDSICFVEGNGLIPTGKRFRITRIQYRVRLDAEGGRNSAFAIVGDGKKLVSIVATQGPTHSDTWSGEFILEPGEEQRFSVTCSKYGLAEILVFGDLIDGR